jgi:cell division septation protein DedD
MTQTDGEKELVLGNKQLISLFFVVVALCGVFFAMGYMIGRNTSKPATTNLEGNFVLPAGSAATQSDVPRSGESEPPRETSAAPVETQPVASVATQPSPAPAETPVVSTRTVAAHDTPAAVPEAGATYLQVTALRRADADNLVKTLREQSFPALLADSSKPDLFRVLVGPYHQTADVADAKARLKSLGFANAFVQK